MALTPWEKTPAGVVAVSTQATLADVRLPDGTPVARTRVYVDKPSRVRIIIEVDGVDTVSFDDTVTPAADSVVEVYNRTIFRESVAAKHVPVDPAVIVAERAERAAAIAAADAEWEAKRRAANAGEDVSP